MSQSIKTAPYGAWQSPICADMLAAQTVRLGGIAMDGEDALWLEGRPTDGGRNVLVCAASTGRCIDVTSAPWNVRSRVHEYGGGAFAARDGHVWFVNDDDQRLYRIHDCLGAGLGAGLEPTAQTPPGPFRYADPSPAANGAGLVCVREEHRDEGEPVNCLVWVHGNGEGVTVIAEGHDFFAYPRLSPDGRALAYIAWDHPNMPWDGTKLYLAPVLGTARIGTPLAVAGGLQESIFQPHWAEDGQLWFVSDANGFWNLHRLPKHQQDADNIATNSENTTHGRAQCVLVEEADYAMPLWQFAMSTYGFADAHTLVAASCVRGEWRVQAIDLRNMQRTDFPLPISSVSALVAGEGQALVLAANATTASCVMRWSLGDNRVEVLRSSSEAVLGESDIAVARTINFPSGASPGSDAAIAHGFYYAPRNSRYRAPDGELPPLMVIGHGGPTGATAPAFDLSVQFWTTRGFAVLDVNYRGSTGYGRHYRSLLDGAWGIADVEDCVNGARFLADAGHVDASRMAIRGRSAGGFTVLAALAFHEVFAAGASYYGIGELEALARDTHKFESRYMDRLIGPYPQCAQIYRDRSPIHHLERLSCPVIFFQGLEDKVVPPNQAQMMHDALKAKGIPVACLMFEGEQHGFRRAQTIVRTLQAELVFYGQVFGFEPVGELPDIEIENL